MKLIIAGGRTLNVKGSLIQGLLNQYQISRTKLEIVTGKAKGVDESGESYARSCGFKVHEFPANWDKHGRGAGPIRNAEMADFADAVLLIWNGESRGSADMKKQMLMREKPVYECILTQCGELGNGL